MTTLAIAESIPAPTLDELAEVVEREHQLALQSGAAMVEHAIRAGEALLKAKELVPHGQWGQWTNERFPDRHTKTIRLYMRLARYSDQVRAGGVTRISDAQRLLAGEALGPRDVATRAEAQRLRARDGLSYRRIGDRLGVSPDRIYVWLNPRAAERRRERRRQESREARRARHREQRAAEVRGHGGSVAEAYSLVRRALQQLDRAVAEMERGEAKAAVNAAIGKLHRAEDDIVKAVRNAA